MLDSDLWPADDAVAGLVVSVAGPDAVLALDRHLQALAGDGVAGRIAAGDPTLWGQAAEAEAAVRLGWVSLPETSRQLVHPILRLREELTAEGVDRVVLCGMGGSSLAAEVIAAEFAVPLVVLDSTDPGQVEAALTDLARTVVVVSSKSGSTVETDSQRRVFEQAFSDAGISARDRIVVVTDPGSPLQKSAQEAGYRAVFDADSTVGGRFSALTAFGLVPAGLAGADIAGLLDQAAAVSDLLADDSDANPALILGAVLGGTTPLRDKVVFNDLDPALPGFADWAEQLIAESTGKNGTGLLPVVLTGGESPELTFGASDVLLVNLLPPGDDGPGEALAEVGAMVGVAGPLGAQFLLWEYAVSVAGRLLRINPFDQPDVESAKAATRGLLGDRPDQAPADAVDAAVAIRATPGLLSEPGDAATVSAAVRALLRHLPGNGYVSVMAYLNREAEQQLAGIRDALARRANRPVTFGWGPRFLHSTGQFHKGGPPIGVYLQITGATDKDLDVPDRPFTFGQLIAAQAAGDASVLAAAGRPVLQLHLTDRQAGLDQLISAFSE
jgi:glucose-6-phosphate isomerase